MAPLILAVETSSRVGSVAIGLGEKLLAETIFSSPMKHSAEIFPAIAGLLERFGKKPQAIEHIYISAGPGSFTGIRIAVTMAKTLHLANAAKIVAVDSLDVTASNVIDLKCHDLPVTGHERQTTSDEKVAAILDAKRNQFFIAVYEKQLTAGNAKNTAEKGLNLNSSVKEWKKIFPDSLMTSDEFLEKFADPCRPIRLLGDGLLYHRDKFKTDGIRFLDEKYWSPRAEKVHLLGWQMALSGRFADPLTLTPNYLLRPDIKVKGS